jgi:hypothetical protein
LFQFGDDDILGPFIDRERPVASRALAEGDLASLPGEEFGDPGAHLPADGLENIQPLLIIHSSLLNHLTTDEHR